MAQRQRIYRDTVDKALEGIWSLNKQCMMMITSKS
jgi:hypothetical protein